MGATDPATPDTTADTPADTPVPLRPDTLAWLDARVARPDYERGGTPPGIVHLGVGGFHRAHEAMYVDRLLEAGCADGWSICGVGVLAGDKAMRDALQPQDGLYTLVVKHADGSLEPRVIGSIGTYLFAPDDPEAVLSVLAAPDTRIVSLTVTEGGYNLDPVTGEFDLTNAAVVDDAQPGVVPSTAFGLITEALHRRRADGVAPFTVMSCDNIPGNGHVTQRMLCAFAAIRSPELAEWIAANVAFPNSMVDRITPVTTDADRATLAERFGVADAWPVVCEPFTQWVLEDHFGSGRPPFERAGVQLVADVEPYELMKLRLLNASHQAIAYLGFLAGFTYAHEVCTDPMFVRYLRDFMDLESTPTLPPVPGVDLEDYKTTLIERFANPEIKDTLARLCAESSDRIPKWVLPIIRSRLAAGGDISRTTLIVAAWARYAEGVDENGGPIEVVDRLAGQLTRAAQAQRDDPLAFVEQRYLFGDLVDDPVFVRDYTSALDSLHAHGARATLTDLLDRASGRMGG